MLERDRKFTWTIIHICEIIFYHYLQIHLMKMKLSFSLLKASYRVLVGLKYLEQIFSIIFTRKGELILLLQEAAFEIGHNY